jgi:hypothetical protein
MRRLVPWEAPLVFRLLLAIGEDDSTRTGRRPPRLCVTPSERSKRGIPGLQDIGHASVWGDTPAETDDGGRDAGTVMSSLSEHSRPAPDFCGGRRRFPRSRCMLPRNDREARDVTLRAVIGRVWMAREGGAAILDPFREKRSVRWSLWISWG